MLNVCGEMYYIDLESVSDVVDMNVELSGSSEQTIN